MKDWIDITETSITAVILAGGKGRRFAGSDKGLIVFKQKRLIEHLLAAIIPQVSDVIINANRNKETYASYGHPVISDTMSDYQGPLAGFSVAMSQVTTSHIITLPCDGPFVSPKRYLSARLKRRIDYGETSKALTSFA